MTISKAALALATALALSGCMAENPAPAVKAANVSMASEFVPMATVSNSFEIATSRLALERSQNRDVRRFATQMINDHSRAARQMAATLGPRTTSVPVALDPPHQAMLDRLNAAGPETFDATYISLQRTAHTEAVTLFTSYAETGDDPRLAAFARRTLPVLRMHAEHVETLAASGTDAAS